MKKSIEVYLGESGLNETWQEPFKPKIKCQNCGKQAKIMFVACENNREGKFICELHKTTGKEGGLWVHDACAVAVYLCPFCFEITGEINQA